MAIIRRLFGDFSQIEYGGDVVHLSNAALALIGNRPVFDITIKDANGAAVSNLDGGTVTIAIPYTPAAAERTGNLYGVYVDANGRPQLLANSNYSDGRVVFERNSLSVYGVGYKTPAPAFTSHAVYRVGGGKQDCRRYRRRQVRPRYGNHP